MKKNVCLLIYDLGSGGAERVLSQWSRLLSEDYNVFMTLYGHNVTYEYGGELCFLEGQANNKNVFTKVLTVLKRAAALKKFVKEKKIDIVISFCNECNLVNTLSSHGTEKICSIRSASDLDSNIFVNYVVKSRNNRIVIQTEALKKTMIERYGAAIADKLTVFGNPFDSRKIRLLASEDAPENLKDILENKKTIVSVASFKRQKNHANLLKCFELVAEQIDDAYLLLVGSDSTGLREKVRGMAAQSRYADRIIFVGELKNPYAVIQKSSVFVLPSLAEGIPNVLAEAMICGCPVVASNCPTGPAELLCEDPSSVAYDKNGVFHGDYGLLVTPFEGSSAYDYEDYSDVNRFFAKAVASVLQDEEFARELKQKAILGARRFDIEQYKADLVALVANCLQ